MASSLGNSVAYAGDVNNDGIDDLIVGAENDGSGAAYGGRAFAIYGSTNGLGNVNLATLTPQQGFALQGTQDSAFAGHVVTGLGDVNGDGIDDIAVSAPHVDSVYVYFGRTGGLNSTTLGPIAPADGFVITGAQYAGWTLATAGDVNGDGYEDIVLGTEIFFNNPSAYVLFGHAGGFGTIDIAHLTADQGFRINPASPNDILGQSVAAAGDVNGDGFDDVIVGRFGGDGAGAAYVIFGSATIGATSVTAGAGDGLTLTSGVSGDGVGNTVAGADVNDDGFSDLQIGAWRGSPNGFASGATYIAYGAMRTDVVALTGTVAGQTLAGGTGDDTLNGVGGDDLLYGNAGHDVLNGGIGNDYLQGGVGADDLTGGTGDDIYVVDTAADVVHELVGQGTDLVIATFSTSLSSYANVENLALRGTGDFDLVGDGQVNALTGNEGANFLQGLGDNDILIGAGGNDRLDGGTGADRMSGGAGDDSYYVESALDVVVEAVNAGNDGVFASIDYSLTANVEALTLTGGAANGTGNDLANTITGTSGANILDGLGGNDTLIGGLGADTYLVDNAGDTIVENANEGTDTAVAAASYTLGANIENLTLALGTGAVLRDRQCRRQPDHRQ